MTLPFTKPEPGLEPLLGYHLIKRLGAGGFGEVWEAASPGGFHVALKLVPVDHARGAVELRSLDIIHGIRHPNLLVPFAAWSVGDWLIIGMELADATLMDRYLEMEAQGLRGIRRDELLQYFHEAAKGIDFLNEPRQLAGGQERVAIQHRDIKPQNILLVGNGVKVADFGLARLMKHVVTSHSGAMTPSYAAPEFFDGRTTATSDQYSLAVTYCKMRGGRLPFVGTLAELMRGHLSRPPDLSMIPQAEQAVVAQALAKEPKDRWPSCRAFVAALQACAGPDAIEVPCAQPGLPAAITTAYSQSVPLGGESNGTSLATDSAPVPPLPVPLLPPPSLPVPMLPLASAGVSPAPEEDVLSGAVVEPAEPDLARGKRSWLIGRGADCDLMVNQEAVSTHHCRLTEAVRGFVLEDLASVNGTYVNGQRVTGRVGVQLSDQVTLGKTTPMPWPTVLARAVAPRVLHIGRDPDNDVVLDYPMVSGRHARIIWTDGQPRIEDLGSTNGTALGRPEHKITQAPLQADDLVYFGSLAVPAARLLHGSASGKDAHVPIPLGGGQSIFGRDAGCDVVLNYPMISGRHARLWREADRWLLEDLGSTNGTFLNGRQIHEPTAVQAGDVIALGSCCFRLNDEGSLERCS